MALRFERTGDAASSGRDRSPVRLVSTVGTPGTVGVIRLQVKGSGMAGKTLVTVVGNLTADPELRFTASGAPVAGFTIASTPRFFARDAGGFHGGDPLFLRCSLWRKAAENAVHSLSKGTRVIVTGRVKSRTFEDKEGQRRTVIEMDVEEIAPSLTYATAVVTRNARASTTPPATSARPTTSPVPRLGLEGAEPADPYPF